MLSVYGRPREKPVKCWGEIWGTFWKPDVLKWGARDTGKQGGHHARLESHSQGQGTLNPGVRPSAESFPFPSEGEWPWRHLIQAFWSSDQREWLLVASTAMATPAGTCEVLSSVFTGCVILGKLLKLMTTYFFRKKNKNVLFIMRITDKLWEMRLNIKNELFKL